MIDVIPTPVWVFSFVISLRVLVPFLKKRTAQGVRGRTWRMLLQFVFAALVADSVAFVTLGHQAVGAGSVVVFVIGAVNALACYADWRATAASQSETALFGQLDDVICLVLGFVVLGEGKFLTSEVTVGLVLVLGGGLAMSVMKSKRASHSEQILHWILVYSMIWGVAVFSKRYYALREMEVAAYTAAWYSGAAVGALAIFLCGSREEATVATSRRELIDTGLLALGIVVGNWTSYICYARLPIPVFQPIDQAAEMIFPTIIGLFLFGEREKIFPPGDRWNKAYLAMMIVTAVGGTILIVQTTI